MRRKSKFKGKRSADRFFMLLAVLLVGYTMVASREDAKPPVSTVPDISAQNVEETELLEPDDDSIVDKLMPSFEIKEQPPSTALDLRLGEGKPAQCGQQVRLQYMTFLLDGTQIENTVKTNTPVMLRIGTPDNKLIPGLGQFALGMRPQGERQVTLPPEKAYDALPARRKDVPLGSPIGVRLKVEEVVEDPYFYEIPNGHFTIISGDSRRMAWCGEEVEVLLYNVDPGKGNLRERLPEEEAKHVRFTTGKKQVPFWLEQTVVGNGRLPPMNMGGIRAVQLDEEMLNGSDTKHWKTLDELGVKREGLATLRVHLIAIGDEKAGDMGTKKKKKEPPAVKEEAPAEEGGMTPASKEPSTTLKEEGAAPSSEEKLPETLPEAE